MAAKQCKASNKEARKDEKRNNCIGNGDYRRGYVLQCLSAVDRGHHLDPCFTHPSLASDFRSEGIQPRTRGPDLRQARDNGWRSCRADTPGNRGKHKVAH